MSEQYSPTGFRVLPPVVKHLLIINAILFLATFTLNRFNIDLSDYLGLHFFLAKDFMPYQLFTYMFMHANFEHIFFNMFALWMFGNTLENIWGSKRFLLFYIICGLGAAVSQEVVQFIDFEMRTDWQGLAILNDGMREVLNTWNTVGASGAVYGLLLAFGMLFPNSRIYLYFLFPIKAKWFVIGYAVIELLSGFFTSGNVAHFAHLGGMLFGLILILIWKKKGKLYGERGF
jgi:membrane associated rhomboid family serine protease